MTLLEKRGTGGEEGRKDEPGEEGRRQWGEDGGAGLPHPGVRLHGVIAAAVQWGPGVLGCCSGKGHAAGLGRVVESPDVSESKAVPGSGHGTRDSELLGGASPLVRCSGGETRFIWEASRVSPGDDYLLVTVFVEIENSEVEGERKAGKKEAKMLVLRWRGLILKSDFSEGFKNP